MRRYLPAAAAAACLLALGASCTSGATRGQEPPARPALRWEYKVVHKAVNALSAAQDEADFTKLGAEGWELCSSAATARPAGVGVVVFVFKRPK